MSEESEGHAKITWTSKGAGQIAFAGLSAPELDAFEGAYLGSNWIRIHEGRLQFAHAFEQPPKPERDKEVGPFWPRDSGFKPHKKVTIHRFDGVGISEPGINISALGAGARGPDVYERNADKLEKYGFEGLRSRRGHDGRYWEIWYLPSLAFAEGELAKAIADGANGLRYGEKEYNNHRLKAAITFLCRNVNFGSLDAVVQRAALTYD